jgi:hypothetical protein
LENHFQKDRLEKKQKNILKKGSKDKADNMTQRFEGVEDTAFVALKTLLMSDQRRQHYLHFWSERGKIAGQLVAKANF